MFLFKLGQSVLMQMDPERAHQLTIKALKSGALPIPKASISSRLAVTLPKSGLQLASPVGLAAGFDKNADVPNAMAKFGFGFLECGTVTPKAQDGNPKPRLFRLKEDRAVINRMGFNNAGLGAFVANLKVYRGSAPIGANVGANKTTEDKAEDYETGIKIVYPYADYITINISSPNTPGLRGLQDKASLSDLLQRCEAAHGTAKIENPTLADRPVFLKLAPDLDTHAVDDIVAVVGNEGSWLAGLIVSNTTLERPDSLISDAKAEAGGLSGTPLMALSTQVLGQFAERLEGRFDLIGAGGIGSAEDAYAKLKAGAHAVQLYSMLVYEGIDLVSRINDGLVELMDRDGVANLQALVDGEA